MFDVIRPKRTGSDATQPFPSEAVNQDVSVLGLLRGTLQSSCDVHLINSTSLCGAGLYH